MDIIVSYPVISFLSEILKHEILVYIHMRYLSWTSCDIPDIFNDFRDNIQHGYPTIAHRDMTVTEYVIKASC